MDISENKETNQLSFEDLYTRYYRKSFLFTKSYIQNVCEAEDIASEALIKLSESIRHKHIENIPAFLLTILKNKSLDYLRSKAVQKKAMETVSFSEIQELNYRINALHECDPDLIFSKEIQQIIDTSLNQLSLQTKQIFIMSRYENYSNKEIATELNMTVKNVEYHISKSLNLLRENLKDYLPLFYFFFYF